MFFRAQPIHSIRLNGQGVMLRAPAMDDFPAWAKLRSESAAFLQPWEPKWPVDDLTRAGFRRRLRVYALDLDHDATYPFLIFRLADGALLGGITLSNVRRGIVQSGALGYWVGAAHAGQGVMSQTLRVLMPFLFDDLRLHRVDAACIPENTASVRLLERSGFVREGLARRYLCINGTWRDHYLYARLADDPPPAPPGATLTKEA